MASIFSNLLKHLGTLANPGVTKAQKEYQEALQNAAIRLKRSGAGVLEAPITQQRSERAFQRAETRYQANPTQARYEKMQMAKAAMINAQASSTQAGLEAGRARETLQALQGSKTQRGLGTFREFTDQASAFGDRTVKSSAMGAAGGVLGAGANAAALAGGPVGVAATAVLALGEAAAKAVEKLREWGDQLLKQNFQFAEFSGAMKRVQVENEIQEMHRSRRRGDAQAESAGRLMQARNRLENAMEPWEAAWAKAKSDFFAPLLEKAAAVLEQATKIAKAVGLLADEDPKDNTMDRFMDEMGASKWYEKFGRPARFGPVPQDRGQGFTGVGGDF